MRVTQYGFSSAMMTKPEKTRKTMRKSKEVAPADNMLIETQCGFCMKQFPDPTTARIHADGEHPGQYEDA